MSTPAEHHPRSSFAIGEVISRENQVGPRKSDTKPANGDDEPKAPAGQRFARLVQQGVAVLGDGYTLAIVAALAGSLKALFVKFAYAAAPIDAISLLLLRLLAAAPFLLWMALRPGPALTRRQWAGLLGIGICGYWLSSWFDFLGLQLISAGLERLVLFTYPTVVLALDSLLHRRRPSRRTLLAVLLTYLGLLAAIGHDLQLGADQLLVLAGAGWVFAAAVMQALYFVATVDAVHAVGATRTAGISGLIALALVSGHFLFSHHPVSLLNLAPAVYGWAGAMGLLCTVLPGWLLALAIGRIGATRAANIGTIGPVITIALGWWLLAEPFSWLQLAGMLLVLAGITALKR